MHIIKITPNLIVEYQCTSGKFIRLPNRIEKIDSAAKIELNRMETFCPNWNALLYTSNIRNPPPEILNTSASSGMLRISETGCGFING